MPRIKLRINCTHHWIIGPSKGGISIGMCIRCNARKEFIGNWEDAVRRIQSPRQVNKVGGRVR